MKKILIAVVLMAGTGGAARAAGMAQETLTAAANVEVTANVPVPQPSPADIFNAQAAWSLGRPQVTAAKRLGVMKAAEKMAVLECREQGLSGCVAVSSRITNWDHFTLTASASARSLVPAGKEVFNADNRWTVPGRGFSELERLGVLKDAEELAIDKCKAAGNLACFAVDSNLTACDKYACTATALAMAFKVAE